MRHRGPLVIHAALSRAEFRGADAAALIPVLPPVEDLPFGCLLRIVDVYGCVPLAEVISEPFAEGSWCILTRDPRPIEPVRWKGRLSLFNVPEDAIRPLLT